MKITHFFSAFVLLLLGLTACSNQSNALAELLASDKPTLLFFYTEN